MKEGKSKFVYIFLIAALSVYALHPLFNKYTFSGHDMVSHIERCIELKYALAHGIIYPRIFTNLCYGYSTPILNYQSPLFYYAVCIVDLFRNNIISSLKFVLGVCLLLSGLFMYQLVRYLWDDKAGVIAGLLYIYTPYHISQLYVRASLTEFFAVTLFPMLTYQL
ncbi:hypothetical protein KKB18_02900, partial [bacterium]|nr:hypothetical protein [bacterium]